MRLSRKAAYLLGWTGKGRRLSTCQKRSAYGASHRQARQQNPTPDTRRQWLTRGGKTVSTPGGEPRHPAPLADPTYPTDALQPLLEELRLLREEVAGLRAELRLIEHKPDKPPMGEKGGREPPSGAAKSFADLLASLDVGEGET